MGHELLQGMMQLIVITQVAKCGNLMMTWLSGVCYQEICEVQKFT